MFSWMNNIAGIKISESSYEGLPHFFMSFFNIFRNTLGDVHIPDVAHWKSTEITPDGKTVTQYQSVIVIYAWLLWLF